MLNVVLTFDYEIFFGRNDASEKEILFDPTDRIVDLLDEYGVKGCFFADVCSIQAYQRECPASDYPQRFRAQMQETEQRGHDVQLHLHPHWITARYDGQWLIDPKTYRIHSFIGNQIYGIDAEEMIDVGIGYLNDSLKPVNSDYLCCAFRAGGYCLEPGGELTKLLSDRGIVIDSSVAIGKRLMTEAHNFDYKKDYPKLNWDIGNGIMEIPIGSTKNSLIRRIMPDSGAQPMVKEPAKGEGISGTNPPKPNAVKRLIHFAQNYQEFALENNSYRQLLYGLGAYRKKYDTDHGNAFVSIICHPKSMESVTMNHFRIFLDKIQECGNWVRIVALADAVKMLHGDVFSQNLDR